MNFIYTLFIAMANNLDNISVRIAYSLRGIKISTSKNLWISMITFIISSCAAFSGGFLSNLFTGEICSYISMILLIFIGSWIIAQPYWKERKTYKKNNLPDNPLCIVIKQPENADLDNSKNIEFKEATLLGIALSIDNIGGGISAGMIGLNPFFVGFFSALVSFLCLWVGNYITKFLSRNNFGKKATIFSGIVLILIGIKQIF